MAYYENNVMGCLKKLIAQTRIWGWDASKTEQNSPFRVFMESISPLENASDIEQNAENLITLHVALEKYRPEVSGPALSDRMVSFGKDCVIPLYDNVIKAKQRLACEKLQTLGNHLSQNLINDINRLAGTYKGIVMVHRILKQYISFEKTYDNNIERIKHEMNEWLRDAIGADNVLTKPLKSHRILFIGEAKSYQNAQIALAKDKMKSIIFDAFSKIYDDMPFKKQLAIAKIINQSNYQSQDDFRNVLQDKNNALTRALKSKGFNFFCGGTDKTWERIEAEVLSPERKGQPDIK